ncbi:MAG TPA: TetR family transcriptional regulator [Gemmatimonadaceae bacterium]
MKTPKRAEPRLRQDAQRNRERLLTVAVAAFTKDASASLDSIAKTAEVGIGTLYRHFPTREALIEAAYRNELEKLCEAAPELLEKHAPDEALGRLMERFIDYMAVKRGMAEALRAVVAAGGNPYNQSRARLTEAVAILLDAGKRDGSIRPDVEAGDVLTMSAALLNTAESPQQARRLAAILVDGLRYRTSKDVGKRGARKKRG